MDVAVIVGTLFVCSAVALAIWLLPRLEIRRWERRGVVNQEKLAELTLNARANVTQALGGFALIATLALTAYQVNETRRTSDRTLRLTERGQVTERFARAVEQLGASNPGAGPAIDVRTGALLSLERIGLDSDRDAGDADLRGACIANAHLAAAQLTFANSRRTWFVSTHLSLANLFSARLDHAVFASSDLRDANLAGADLTGAWLGATDNQRSDFRGARLKNSNLAGAHLEFADLRKADLRGAFMEDATLNAQGGPGARADLRGADLRDATLPKGGLRGAIVDATTRTR